MKKYIVTTILMVLTVLCSIGLSSCGAGDSHENDGRIKVVATIFPEYDWVREIVGADNDKVDVDLLVSNGADLHSYQPSVDDIMKISACDLFIYVGGESDAWVKDVIDRADNDEMKVICLMDVLGGQAKEEELTEGMEDHDHEHEEEREDEDHDHEKEYDEHVWLSLRNAAVFCDAIKEELCGLDASNKKAYEKNTEDYLKKISELDLEYDRIVAEAGTNVLVFGDRFPFRYLTDDLGLKYYAAFAGCSAETEASFETVRFLAGKVDEYDLDCIMIIDGSDGKIAKTVSENTKHGGQKILKLDSMQSVTQKEIDEGASYLGIMEDDLKVLEQALGVDR